MAEFSPQELDQLEDALEGLEDLEDLERLGLSEALTERLGEYQHVMQASRESMPMEEVPEGLLDGVLAEAREAKPVEQAGVGFWERWRKTLIPVFALAGTTAAVLLIVRPDQDVGETLANEEMKTTPEGSLDGEDATPTPAAAGSAVSEKSEDPAMSDDEPAPSAAPPTEAEAVQAEAPARQRAATDAKQKKADFEPGDLAEEQVLISDKDDFYREKERADALRKTGNCADAKRLYLQLKPSSPNSKAEAQIEKGLGLCTEAMGGDASKHYSNAIAADGSIELEIERDREDLKGADRKGKPQPKKKRKSSAKSQNAYDAIGD